MNYLLLELPLRHSSDLLRARQRARQLAGLLGYTQEHQTIITAAVFEIAGSRIGQRGARVRFQLAGDTLQVVAMPRSALRLEMELPAGAKLDRADLAWAIQTLDKQSPLEVRQELRQMNQELLGLLAKLHGGQLLPAVAGKRCLSRAA